MTLIDDIDDVRSVRFQKSILRSILALFSRLRIVFSEQGTRQVENSLYDGMLLVSAGKGRSRLQQQSEAAANRLLPFYCCQSAAEAICSQSAAANRLLSFCCCQSAVACASAMGQSSSAACITKACYRTQQQFQLGLFSERRF